MMTASAGTTAGADVVATDQAPDEGPALAKHFDAARCLNCDAPLATAYCGECGQKAARRFTFRDFVKESWDRLRLFELKSVKTVGRLATSPGVVAREYVMGRRGAYMHPLTLLIALVALLVVILATNSYFVGLGGAEDEMSRMTTRVMSYANWSFSLGIFAIFLGSWTVFRRRFGYNSVEHAVLAVYVQCIILVANVVNLVPTLIWSDTGFITAHREAAQYYMAAIKLGIVAIAYRQFFQLDRRPDWPRLALACGVYSGASWLLLRAYAAAIFWLVT